MAANIKIEWNAAGFAECLNSLAGTVEEAAEKRAEIATSMLTGPGTGFHVEMSNEPRFLDAVNKVTRPIARVVSNDEETAKEEAENKILSRSLYIR